jgi:hypothetical protein
MANEWQFSGWDPQITNAVKGGALGRGPSAAEAMSQSLFDRAMRQAMGIGATQRGVPASMGLRQTLQAQGALQGQATNQAAQLRAQEQQQAMAQALQMLMGQQQGFYQGKSLEQQQEMYDANRKDAWTKMLLGGLLNAGGSALSMGMA